MRRKWQHYRAMKNHSNHTLFACESIRKLQVQPIANESVKLGTNSLKKMYGLLWPGGNMPMSSQAAISGGKIKRGIYKC